MIKDAQWCRLTCRHKNEGAALMLTLGYLAVITLFASAFLVSLHRTMDGSTRNTVQQQSMAIAEGGLEKALAELRHSAGAYRGELSTPLGEGTFSVEVTAVAQSNAYRIVSTGTLPQGVQTCITAKAQLSAQGTVAATRWIGVE